MTVRVRLRQSAFGRWIVTPADDIRDRTAWSGSRFVAIDEHGLPAGDAQVSNFDTREDAAAYARSFKFEVVE